MAEAKHTPGPWTWAKYSPKRFGVGQRGEGAFFLLQCVHDDTSSPAAIADARLMASSPMLLDALHLAKQHIDDLVALYASEFCEEERVKQAADRINATGMLHASATVLEAIGAAIAKATS